MIPDCTGCGHSSNLHRPDHEGEDWECRQLGCDCWQYSWQYSSEEVSLGEVQPYSPASAQPMSADQLVDADEEERAYQAQKLLVAGHSWNEIASMTGYPSAGAAQVSVRAMRQRAALALSSERREEMLDLEMARLEELLKSAWPAAMSGDLKSAEFTLKVISQQSRMLGLEELSTRTKVEGSKTIIIAGTSNEYAAALKQIVEGS